MKQGHALSLPKGWEIVKLPEVVFFQEGPGLRKFQYTETGIPFLNIRTLVNDRVDKSLCGHLSEKEVNEKYKHFLLKDGDIICSTSGTIGKLAIIHSDDLPLMLNTSVIRFRELDKTIVFKKFIYYYLKSNLFLSQATDAAKGQAQVNFGPSHLKNFNFTLPPIPEQKRIVSILDEAFAVIEKAIVNAEQNLKNAKELFESYLQGVIENKGEGWEEKTLKEISLEFARGKSKHRPRGDASLLNGKYPLIQTGDIRNANHWINEYSQTYNEKGLAQSKLWNKGTICIAIVGANVAETAILNFDACFPDSVIGIVVNPKKANNEYVEYLLQTFKTYLKEKGKGTARDNINLGTFESQCFPFPSVKEQIAVVKRLDTLSTETKKLEVIYQHKLNDLEELKKSVLQKAFSGELKTKSHVPNI